MSYNSIQAISLAHQFSGIKNAYYDGVVLSGGEIRVCSRHIRLTDLMIRRLHAISLALGGFKTNSGASQC